MTFEEVLAGMPTDQLKKDIADLQDIISMKNAGATSDDISAKYSSVPDDPISDLAALQAELTKRGASVSPIKRNIILLIAVTLVIIYLVRSKSE